MLMATGPCAARSRTAPALPAQHEHPVADEDLGVLTPGRDAQVVAAPDPMVLSFDRAVLADPVRPDEASGAGRPGQRASDIHGSRMHDMDAACRDAREPTMGGRVWP